MIENLQEFAKNYEHLIALINCVMTFILSLLIGWLTITISLKQIKQDKTNNEKQLDFQIRQFKIDTFQLKNEIYHNVVKFFSLVGELQNILVNGNISLEEKTLTEISILFECLIEACKVDSDELLWNLQEGRYIFQDDSIKEEFNSLQKRADQLFGDIGKLALLDKILLENEKEMEKIKILQSIRKIVLQINFIYGDFLDKLTNSLDISDLYNK